MSPAQEPPVPIVIGGGPTRRRVAWHGDGSLDLWVSPGRYAAAAELIAKYAADDGRPVRRWEHGMHVWCGLGASAATARARLGAVMEAFYQVAFGPGGAGRVRHRDDLVDAVRSREAIRVLIPLGRRATRGNFTAQC